MDDVTLLYVERLEVTAVHSVGPYAGLGVANAEDMFDLDTLPRGPCKMVYVVDDARYAASPAFDVEYVGFPAARIARHEEAQG